MNITNVINSLPAELNKLHDHNVWCVITKNPKFTQANAEDKYFGFKNRNDPSQHVTIAEAKALWNKNSVLTLSVALANRHLLYKLNFCDVDFYVKGYNDTPYRALVKDTWVGVSPSGNGAHALIKIKHNHVLNKAKQNHGYDWYENQYLTFGESSNGLPVIAVSAKVQVHELDLSPTNASGEALLIIDGKMSVPFVFNKTYSLTEILESNGCTLHRNGKWKYPDSAGAGGILVQDATQLGREGQQVCLVFHNDSMNALCVNNFPKHKRHKDAFELQAWFDNPNDKDYYSKAVRKYAELKNPNDATQTINEYNKDRTLTFTLNPCEPIQRMIDAYTETISMPIKPFVTATVYSHLSLFMQGTVKMPLMELRTVNTLFMLLAFSTAGKDNNVSIPTRGIAELLIPLAVKQNLGNAVKLLQGMVSRMPKVTSLSALLKALDYDV